MLLEKLLFAVLAYVLATIALVGDPLQPIALATVWSDRLGIPHWRAIAVLGVAASALVYTRPLKNLIHPAFRPAIFVIVAVLLPTATIGVCADWIRHNATRQFGADEVEEHSFFMSTRNAPAEDQYFLHTAALKNCRAYTWSYRYLAFSELSPDIGANVLPDAWIKRCKIVQTDRR